MKAVRTVLLKVTIMKVSVLLTFLSLFHSDFVIGFKFLLKNSFHSLSSSKQFLGKEVIDTNRYFSIPELIQYAQLFGLNVKIIDNQISLRLEAFTIDNESDCIGYLTAFLRPIPFKLLQLDTIQVKNRRQNLGFRRTKWSPDGSTVTFIMGSIALRWAYDKGCSNAELLAVKDSDKMHRILVRLYENFGFTILRDVGDDSTLQNISDRLLWGAVGTLMSIDIKAFLEEWTPKFFQSLEEKTAATSAIVPSSS